MARARFSAFDRVGEGGCWPRGMEEEMIEIEESPLL